MNTFYKVVLLLLLLVLASCATPQRQPSAGAAPSTGAAPTTVPAQPPGALPGQPLDGRGTDTYAYGRNGQFGGQVIGGPDAPQTSRIVYFDFDSTEIRADSRPIVEAHARYLLDNPGAATVLEGHTDERGTREYNIGLGERRAEAVRRLMSAYGVAPSQIRTVSYGEESPASFGQDEIQYAQNRRVEIVY